MTTCTGEGEQLAIAQQVLDEHITSSVDGRCLKCGVPGPCYRRETAVVVSPGSCACRGVFLA